MAALICSFCDKKSETHETIKSPIPKIILSCGHSFYGVKGNTAVIPTDPTKISLADSVEYSLQKIDIEKSTDDFLEDSKIINRRLNQRILGVAVLPVTRIDSKAQIILGAAGIRDKLTIDELIQSTIFTINHEVIHHLLHNIESHDTSYIFDAMHGLLKALDLHLNDEIDIHEFCSTAKWSCGLSNGLLFRSKYSEVPRYPEIGLGNPVYVRIHEIYSNLQGN